MTGLTWSTNQPDRPWFYWCRLADKQSIVLFVSTKAGLVMDNNGLGVPIEGIKPGIEWAGPIPDPLERDPLPLLAMGGSL